MEHRINFDEPDTTDPEINKLIMEAIWLRRGPAGVSKSDLILKLAEEKNIKVTTITIPVPEEWKSIFEMEDEEREQEIRDDFWKNHKEG